MVNRSSILLQSMTEKQLQQLVVQSLQLLGYTVFESGKARTKVTCPSCRTRHYATGWQGNTIGLPDLYVHNTKWKIPIGVGIELKTEKGKVQTKQQIYSDMQVTRVCRSLDEVLNEIHTVELVIGNEQTIKKIEEFINNEFRQR
jgi:hypothetical protein